MANKLTPGKIFMTALIGGGVTGMGNGSVFGAALMCTLGRGRFEEHGIFYSSAFDPTTFQGFIDWCMLVFGAGFIIILLAALYRHGQLEGAGDTHKIGVIPASRSGS